jgi:DUF4097 and DUF4098 domain-containing protein YvlB
MSKRIATLLVGIALIVIGALLFVAPERAFAVMRLWPVALILAGMVRVLGYLIDRHPRSPVGGTMIMAIGGILISARLLGHDSFILILGKYWFLILLAYVTGRLLKQYTHRIEDGLRPNAFSTGAILVMILIAGAGLAASFASKSNAGRLDLNLRFGDLGGGDYIFSNQISIEDETPQSFEIAPNSRLLINNANGDVEINSAPQSRATARLIRRIRAANAEEARKVAKNISLQIAHNGVGYQFKVAADGVQQDFSVSIVVTLPQNLPAGVEINNALGGVKLNGLQGVHVIRGCERAEISRNNGGVTVENPRGAVEISEIQGPVSLANTRQEVKMRAINGALSIKSENGAVEVEDVRGQATIEATRDVTVRNFRGPLKVSSRDGAIDLETSEILTSDISAVSERGKIRVSIPKDSGFRLDANAGAGRVRAMEGFDDAEWSSKERSYVGGYNITDSSPLVSLRSSRGEIQLRSSGLAVASPD